MKAAGELKPWWLVRHGFTMEIGNQRGSWYVGDEFSGLWVLQQGSQTLRNKLKKTSVTATTQQRLRW
jgi:hypothetical protein